MQIGLAVGDTQKVEENATLTYLGLQVYNYIPTIAVTIHCDRISEKAVFHTTNSIHLINHITLYQRLKLPLSC